MRRLLVGMALCGLVGCSDSTGLSPPTVSGQWQLEITNFHAMGISCNVGGLVMTLTQSEIGFTGTYGSGTLSCFAGGQTIIDDADYSGVVVSGTISEFGSVQFDLDSQDFHLIGTISDNSMSGTADWRFNFGGAIGPVTFLGNWSAARM